MRIERREGTYGRKDNIREEVIFTPEASITSASVAYFFSKIAQPTYRTNERVHREVSLPISTTLT